MSIRAKVSKKSSVDEKAVLKESEFLRGIIIRYSTVELIGWLNKNHEGARWGSKILKGFMRQEN